MKLHLLASAVILISISTLISCDHEEPIEPRPYHFDVHPETWEVAEYGGYPIVGSDTTMYKYIPYIRPAEGIVDFTWAGLGLDILKFGGGLLKDYAKIEARTALGDFVKGLLFGESPDPTMKKLDEIIEKIDAIQKQLDVLQATMDEVQKKIDEQAFNDFRRDLDVVLNLEYAYRTHARRYYFMLEKATTDDEIRSILTEWATTSVSGNQACEQGFNFIQQFIGFKRKYLSNDLTVFGLYDLVAFDNYAWENEGYESRDTFRATTAADILLGMTMSYMFFCMNNEDQMADTCVAAIEKALSYYEANPLIKSDKAVCQIAGAYLTFDRDNCWSEHKASKFGSMIWLDSDKSVFNPFTDHLGTDQEIAAYKQSQITLDEYNILVSYYKNLHSDLTLMEALEQEQGITIPDALRPKYQTQALYDGLNVNVVSTNNYLLLQDSKAVMWDGGSYFSSYSKKFRVETMRRADAVMDGLCMQQGSVIFFDIKYNVEGEGNWGYESENISDWKDKYTAKEAVYLGVRDTDMPHFRQWKVSNFYIPCKGKVVAINTGALNRYKTFWDIK